MGYFDGFLVTLKQHRLFGGDARHDVVLGWPCRQEGQEDRGPRREDRQARAHPRPPRAQPVRGRHGEVHRLRAVRRRLPRRLHLRARRRQRRRSRRRRPASATGSCTRSTTSAASTATCASRRARRRRSPRASCSSSASPNRTDAIYTKAELVVDDTGKPQQLPWEDWRDGEDVLTSGWMRATSPSGDADFIGEVGWSNELGHGLRTPEPKQADADKAIKTVRSVGRGRGEGSASDEPPSSEPRREQPGRWRARRQRDGAVRLHRRVVDDHRWRCRRDPAAEPGARRDEPDPHAVRRGRDVRRDGGALPRRRPGDRLRRRDRRAVPVRDHAARRRPCREPAASSRSPCSDRSRSSSRWASSPSSALRSSTRARRSAAPPARDSTSRRETGRPRQQHPPARARPVQRPGVRVRAHLGAARRRRRRHGAAAPPSVDERSRST